MTIQEIVINWELSLNDYQHKKLLDSKLNVIQCYNIDTEEKRDNLYEQAWDIETYQDLFYSDEACYREEYRDNDDR